MENAVDALKIAFGFLVFVTAITIAFMLFSQAKLTSDAVMFSSDNTNFYTYEEEKGESIVRVDTVIAMLYRYYKEALKIDVYLNSESPKVFDLSDIIPNNLTPKEYVDDYVENELLNLAEDTEFEESFINMEGITKIVYKKR